MGYIFVSYSRRQMYFAEGVALSLQRAGFDVWFDLQKLGPGMDWGSTLKEGYNNCEKLVLIASKAAVESPYVRVEWEAALQNGKEVIVILTEAVILPESLRKCAAYDARTHFDRTIQSLITYLRDERPARHDATPAPGKFPFPLKMPPPIWFTIFVMALPALCAWLTTALFPVGEYWYLYAIGAGIGLYLLLSSGLALFRFWRHSIRYEEIKNGRWTLLWTQLVTSIVCCLVPFLAGAGLAARVVGLLILLMPLVTGYWAFRVLSRSADILRWFPSGDADQDVRESIQGKLVAEEKETQPMPEAPLETGGVAFAVHHHAADRKLGELVTSVFQTEGCTLTPEERANTQLIIVTNRTSKQWLAERNSSLSGRIIPILGTNIDTSPEIQPLLQKQVVDLRMGSVKTIRALASRLANEESTQVSYAMQVAPKAFNSFYSVPLFVWVLWWAFLLAAAILILMGISRFGQGGAILVLLGIAVWLCFDLLMMRKIPLPAFFHKMTGHRFAWFASMAPASKDPVGMDKKRRLRLLRWAFLPLVVFSLSDMFQPPDPIENYSLEFEMNGKLYRSAGDTLYIMIDGTPVPYSINGTPVDTPEP